MNLNHLILRPIFNLQSRSRCSTSNYRPTLLTAKADPVNIQDETLPNVYTILEKSNPIEPALEPISPKLSRSLVTRIVQNPPNSQSGFRFFIWATRRRRFRSRVIENLICDMLVQEGGFDLYWKTLQELRDCKVSISSDAFRVLIMGYWMIGDAEKAIEVFEKMRDFDCQPNILAYNAILHILVQKDMILLAESVRNLMLKSGCSPNTASYTILIEGLLKSGKSQDALCLFEEMFKKVGISPNNITYSILLSGLCQANKEDTALSLFDNMSNWGCQPDEVAYRSFLNGLCKLGRFNEAFKVLGSFQKEGYEICIKVYSCIIDGLFRARRFHEACQWFCRIFKGISTPDLVFYSIMIKGFFEAGRVSDALHFRTEMIVRGSVPDTQCYNALIKGFCILGHLDDALLLKREMLKNDCFPNAYTYSVLIHAMCEHGFVLKAIQNFEEMEKPGCSPSVVTFNSFIHELCKAGEHKKADRVFCKMDIGKVPPWILLFPQEETLKRLASSFLKSYKLLSRPAPDITTYNILIYSLCKRKDIDGARNIFKILQRVGPKPDSVTYGTLISGCCQLDKIEVAEELLDVMINSEVVAGSSPYKSLMTGLCREKQVSKSFALWLKYLRSLEKWDDGEVKLLEDRLEKGGLVEAINALLEMDLKKKEFDLNPYSIWLIGLCQAGNVKDALEIFYILQDYKINVTPPSCVWLIQFLCRQGKLKPARGVFFYTIDKGWILKPRICNVLMTSLLHSPSAIKHCVFDLVREMESIGYDVNSVLYDTTRTLLETYRRSKDSLMVTR